jgi:hypothetical protein
MRSGQSRSPRRLRLGFRHHRWRRPGPGRVRRLGRKWWRGRVRGLPHSFTLRRQRPASAQRRRRWAASAQRRRRSRLASKRWRHTKSRPRFRALAFVRNFGRQLACPARRDTGASLRRRVPPSVRQWWRSCKARRRYLDGWTRFGRCTCGSGVSPTRRRCWSDAPPRWGRSWRTGFHAWRLGVSRSVLLTPDIISNEVLVLADHAVSYAHGFEVVAPRSLPVGINGVQRREL